MDFVFELIDIYPLILNFKLVRRDQFFVQTSICDAISYVISYQSYYMHKC